MIYLNLNLLTGTIPTEIGLVTNNLDNLFLNNNQLTGIIPSELGNLHDLLLYAHLGTNQLTGKVPTELGRLTVLREISIDNNIVTGDINPIFCGDNNTNNQNNNNLTFQSKFINLYCIKADNNNNNNNNMEEVLCDCCTCPF